MVPVETSVIKTLAYFDLFDYPLSLAELHRYLWQAPSVTQGELESIVGAMAQIEQTDGWYSLKGRSNIVSSRAERYLEANRKYKKRFNIIRLLTYLPHVQAIFIVNSLAIQNARIDSDIDLLIISSPGKIWSARFFTTMIAKLLGIRPNSEFKKDTVCLSFYMDKTALKMNNLSQNPEDVYEMYWLRQLVPVYDPGALWKHIDDANQWMKQILPNADAVKPHPDRTIKHTWLHSLSHALLGLLCIEPLWKWLQLKILPQALKDLAGPVETSVVVLSDTLLKFHTKDPRPAWTQRWRETVEKYSL